MPRPIGSRIKKSNQLIYDKEKEWILSIPFLPRGHYCNHCNIRFYTLASQVKVWSQCRGPTTFENQITNGQSYSATVVTIVSPGDMPLLLRQICTCCSQRILLHMLLPNMSLYYIDTVRANFSRIFLYKF